jgi:hypothetical protein
MVVIELKKRFFVAICNQVHLSRSLIC